MKASCIAEGPPARSTPHSAMPGGATLVLQAVSPAEQFHGPPHCHHPPISKWAITLWLCAHVQAVPHSSKIACLLLARLTFSGDQIQVEPAYNPLPLPTTRSGGGLVTTGWLSSPWAVVWAADGLTSGLATSAGRSSCSAMTASHAAIGGGQLFSFAGVLAQAAQPRG